jgi:transcriptional regulator with XRE-family HTH domain
MPPSPPTPPIPLPPQGRKVPPLPSLTVTALRRAQGLTEDELAQLTGIPRKRISRLETGDQEPTREELEAIAGALGHGAEDLDFVLLGLRGAPPAAPPRTPVDPTPAELAFLRPTATRLGLAAIELAEAGLAQLVRTRKARRAHRAAARLWKRLQPLPSARRWLLVEKAREFQTWALAVRLDEESTRAAAADAVLALDLARLAHRVAELAPGEPAWRSGLQGFTLPFVGNALRVLGKDMPAANGAFAQAQQLWEAAEGVCDHVLPAWRRLDLEASLRRDQKHWAWALELLDQAQAIAPSEAVGRILLKRSSVLVPMGEGEAAVEVLRRAAPLVDGRRDPRLLSILRFNLVANLILLERYVDAEVLLPEARELAIGLGNELDVHRTLWLTGQVDAGLGRYEEAIAALEQVLAEFTNLEMACDAALVALELSVLYLGQGRTAEVRVLSVGTAWIFRQQQVDEETLKTLTLFREAVELEVVTAELARRLVRQLTLARMESGLGCEP